MSQENTPIKEHALSLTQWRVLRQVGPVSQRWGYYLAGGTAVALYLAHRRSVDLDWFSPEPPGDPLMLAQALREAGVGFVTRGVGPGTLHGTVARVEVSFLEYRYAWLRPPVEWQEIPCRLASLDDLACMKLAAVAQRGAKKDFVDVYALGVAHRPLGELIALYQRRYSVTDISHLLYGLVYFDDADRQRLPTMMWPVKWPTIRTTIQAWVKEISA